MTNIKPLPGFAALNAAEQFAVQLRAEGKSYLQISAGLEAEFGLKRAESTIREWFSPAGKLLQATNEWNEALADSALRDARSLVKRASKNAAIKAIEVMNGDDQALALKSALALMNKYVPDARPNNGRAADDVIPADLEFDDELADEGNRALQQIRTNDSSA